MIRRQTERETDTANLDKTDCIVIEAVKAKCEATWFRIELKFFPGLVSKSTLAKVVVADDLDRIDRKKAGRQEPQITA